MIRTLTIAAALLATLASCDLPAPAPEPAVYEVVARVPTPGYAQDVFVRGDRAYIADGQAGLAVFDIADPLAPVLLGSVMDSLNEAYGVVADESLAFVAYGYKELLVARVGDPESLVVVSELEYPQPGYGFAVASRDSFVYIAADAQFLVVELADARYPNLAFQYRYPRGLRGICVQDTLCFLALEQLGVAIWNTATLPPVPLGSFDTPSNARAVAASGNWLYVCDGRDGLRWADVTDPANPALAAGRLELPGYANRLTVDDTLLYVGCGDGGLAVVSIAEPGDPKLVATGDIPYARNAAGSGGFVFAA
ncbi:hypothetical protein JXB37_03590, partial [candidate division WOR-3 bacterium]|nr:hypothetical protein [candidate division WOR-3 bacterium]